eukprot:10500021-Ditylum_brightwellii.AAC.1
MKMIVMDEGVSLLTFCRMCPIFETSKCLCQMIIQDKPFVVPDVSAQLKDWFHILDPIKW